MADSTPRPPDDLDVAAMNIHYTDERVRLLAEARYRLDEDRCCSGHAGLLLSGELLCTVCYPLGHRVPVAALAKVLPTGERIRVETLAGAQ